MADLTAENQPLELDFPLDLEHDDARCIYLVMFPSYPRRPSQKTYLNGTSIAVAFLNAFIEFYQLSKIRGHPCELPRDDSAHMPHPPRRRPHDRT
jgi:hypothetical protein